MHTIVSFIASLLCVVMLVSSASAAGASLMVLSPQEYILLYNEAVPTFVKAYDQNLAMQENIDALLLTEDEKATVEKGYPVFSAEMLSVAFTDASTIGDFELTVKQTVPDEPFLVAIPYLSIAAVANKMPQQYIKTMVDFLKTPPEIGDSCPFGPYCLTLLDDGVTILADQDR